MDWEVGPSKVPDPNNLGAHSSTYPRKADKVKTGGRLVLMVGSACLLIVLLMHVAEAFHIFPAMGWGLPNSIGHYLDLASAILGVALLLIGFIASRLRGRL